MIELFPVLVVLAFTLFRLVKAGTKGELGQALRTFISPTEEWGPRFVSKNINLSRQLVLDQKLVKSDQYECARKLLTLSMRCNGSNGANGANGSNGAMGLQTISTNTLALS